LKEEEEARIAAEAEAQRLKEEEEARIAAEAEAQRLKEEEEARIAAEAEAQRLKEEEEARIAAEAEAQRLKEEEDARIAAEAEAQRLKEEEDARIAAEFERLAIEQASIDNIRRKEEENALRLAEDQCVSLNVMIEESDSANNLDASFQTAELDIDQDNDLTFLSQSTGHDGDDSVLEEQARYEEEADELRLLTESFSSNSTPTRAKNEHLKIKTMEESAPHDGVKSDMLISPNTQPTVDDEISSPTSSDAKISSPGKNDPPAPAEPVNCGCCVIS
jgi:membrane protein involved in colicin uptake